MISMDKIIECEIKYAKCFCEATEQQEYIRVRDELIPDMVYHNYTRIKSAKDDSALIRLIETEIDHSKSTGKDFCLIRCHIPVNESISERLSHKPDDSESGVSGYYALDISRLPKPNSTKECSVRKIDTLGMIEDLLRLDLQHDEGSLGRDFCTRRVYRRKDVYLSDEGITTANKRL